MKKITNKIILLAFGCTLIIGISTTVLFYYLTTKEQEKNLKIFSQVVSTEFDNLIKDHVDISLSMLENIERSAEQGLISSDTAKLIATEVLRRLSYGEEGYFWVDKPDGTNVILLGSETEGTNRLNATDVRGKLFIKEIINNGVNGGGFTSYHFRKKSDTSVLEKRGYSKYFKPYDWVVGTGLYNDQIQKSIAVIEASNKEALRKNQQILLATVISLLGLAFVLAYVLGKRISSPVIHISEVVKKVSVGDLDVEAKVHSKDELKDLSVSINNMVQGFSEISRFAVEIGKGNYATPFTPLSEHDMLGHSLLEMKNNLETNAAEDKRRNWATEGFAKFATILRTDHANLEQLAYTVVIELVKYVNANQAGLFLSNENEKGDIHLELTACYAYSRKKFLKKSLQPGEGLVGQAFLEKDKIYLREIPHDYLEITSGLGGANPRSILIVPLISNDKVMGIIEMASFTDFDDYVIEFIERVAEIIASTISSVKINLQTKKLLEVSQQLTEEMRAQEEEMRQNMEELEATQEEMKRREAENKIEEQLKQAVSENG